MAKEEFGSEASLSLCIFVKQKPVKIGGWLPPGFDAAGGGGGGVKPITRDGTRVYETLQASVALSAASRPPWSQPFWFPGATTVDWPSERQNQYSSFGGD